MGAAILGGIFNRSILSQLKESPMSEKSELPHRVDDIIQILQSSQTHPSVEFFLKQSFYTATHHVYWGMLITAILIWIVLLFLPNTFPIVEDHHSK